MWGISKTVAETEIVAIFKIPWKFYFTSIYSFTVPDDAQHQYVTVCQQSSKISSDKIGIQYQTHN